MEGEEIRVRMPRSGEVLGIIDSMLGANKLLVRCQDEKIRICRIPGKMRKRIWMREGDAVLVKPWSVQADSNGDVVWKYNPTEASWLRKRRILTLE